MATARQPTHRNRVFARLLRAELRLSLVAEAILDQALQTRLPVEEVLRDAGYADDDDVAWVRERDPQLLEDALLAAVLIQWKAIDPPGVGKAVTKQAKLASSNNLVALDRIFFHEQLVPSGILRKAKSQSRPLELHCLGCSTRFRVRIPPYHGTLPRCPRCPAPAPGLLRVGGDAPTPARVPDPSAARAPAAPPSTRWPQAGAKVRGAVGRSGTERLRALIERKPAQTGSGAFSSTIRKNPSGPPAARRTGRAGRTTARLKARPAPEAAPVREQRAALEAARERVEHEEAVLALRQELERAHKQADAERATRVTEMHALDEARQQLTEQLVTTKAAAEAARQQAADLELQLESARERVAGLEANTGRVQEKAQAAEAESSARISELEAAIGELRERLRTFEQDHAQSLQTITTLQSERDAARDLLTVLQGEAARAAESITALQQERDTAHKHVIALKNEGRAARFRIAALETAAADSAKRSARMRAWAREAEELIKTLKRDRGLAKEYIAAVTKEASEAVAVTRGQRDMAKKAVKQLKLELSAAHEALQAATETGSQLDEQETELAGERERENPLTPAPDASKSSSARMETS